MNGELRTLLPVLFRGLADAGEETHTVGERRQAVEVRELRDLRLGMFLCGDVLVNRNPPAVGQRPPVDRIDASGAAIAGDVIRRAAPGFFVAQSDGVFGRILEQVSSLDAGIENRLDIKGLPTNFRRGSLDWLF